MMQPDEITADTVVRPHDDVAGVEIDGESVLYDQRSGALHHLDTTATLVWAYLDGSDPLRDVAVELAQAAGAPVDVVERDVVALAHDLGRRGLLDGVIGRHDLPADEGGAKPYADPQEEEC